MKKEAALLHKSKPHLKLQRRKKMRPSSAKAKGRRLAKKIKDLILEHFPSLKLDDVLVTSSGVTGEDLVFSPAARKLLPLASECKNCEKLNIWEAYDQAKGHAESTPYEPIVWFGKNGRAPLVCLDANAFLALLASGIEHDPMGDEGDTE